MATPIGHALAGYAVYSLRGDPKKLDLPLLAMCTLLAVIPDLDFVPGIPLGHPLLYHQGVSHSLAFAVGVGLLAVVASKYRRIEGVLKTWGLFTLAYASHLALDMCSPDGRPPYGIPLFWPVSDATFLAPITLFLGVHHAASTSATTYEWAVALLHPMNVAAIGLEMAVLLPLVWFVRWGRSNSGRQDAKQSVQQG